MGAWSAAILGNDTSCEVYERFIQLYDLGEKPESIANIILEEQKENMLYDRTNVWFGLALSCWECKVLTKEIFEEVKNIVDTKEDIKFNEELDADSVFLKKREVALENFIAKISKEKEKPRSKKKVSVQVESPYTAGMCLSYKNMEGKYIGIYLTNSEHYRNKGAITFWFLDFESDITPDLKMFRDARLFGLKKLGAEWGSHEYMGNVTELNYEKDTKVDFFLSIDNVLKFVGKLGICDSNKLTNNYKIIFTNLINPANAVQVLEKNRVEGKLKHDLSILTLNQLIEKIELRPY